MLIGGPWLVEALGRHFIAGTAPSVGAAALGSAPVERLTFYGVVGIGAAAYLVAAKLRSIGVARTFRPESRAGALAGVFAAAVIVTGVVENSLAVDARVVTVIPEFSQAALAVAMAVAAGVTVGLRFGIGGFISAHRSVQFAIAGTLAAAALVYLPSLIHINGGVTDEGDNPFYFSELGAVFGGRAPGWDFASQYSTLLPYIVWIASGAGIIAPQTMIPVVVTAANATIVGAILMALRNSGATILATAALTIVVVAAWCYVAPNADFGMAAYLAISPIRLLVLVPLLLAVRQVAGGRMSARMMLAGLPAVYVIAVAINVEWGLAAIGAISVVAFRTSAEGIRSRLAAVLVPLTVFSVVILFVAELQQAFGAPMGALNSVLFIRWAAVDGALQLALLLPHGIEWPIIATFAAAIFVGAIPARDLDRRDHRGRAFLLAMGVFGILTTSYFFYRPVSTTATALYPAWAITGSLLLIYLARRVIGSATRADLVPVGALVLLGCLPVMALLYPTPPRANWERLVSGRPEWRVSPSGDVAGAVAALRRPTFASDLGTVGVISPFMAVDAHADGAQVGLPVNSSGYLLDPRFADLTCSWLKGRFAALVLVPYSDGEAERNVLSCAGFRMIAAKQGPTETAETWIPAGRR